MLFRDRRQAGRELAELLRAYESREDVVVLGLPRGGVPVAFEVAQRLQVPLDIFLVRKLGVPGQEELAMGAIASGGVRVLNQQIIRHARISSEEIEQVIAAEQQELARREHAFRGARPHPQLRGKTLILVDDGLATGSTMLAAATAVRHFDPGRIVVAVPVAAASTCEEFRQVVDQVVCAHTPDPFHAVGLYYDDFSQTTDQEVWDLLQLAAHAEAEGYALPTDMPAASASHPAPRDPTEHA